MNADTPTSWPTKPSGDKIDRIEPEAKQMAAAVVNGDAE
jgi:hypothetical protein